MKKILKALIIFTIIFTTVIALGMSYFMKKDIDDAVVEKKEEETFENLDVSDYKERVNILMMGVDTLETKKDERGTRSDTIMIFSIDPVTNTAFILSIPRDSYVKLYGTNEYDKINHAHSYGGTDLALNTIKEFIKIPIHHYVKVDYRALFKTVDDLGGIEFNVPVDMKYTDTRSNPPLNINLKAGVQTLNGEQAMGLLRFRSGYADRDLGRIKIQQEFIETVLKKLTSPTSISKIPNFIDTVYQYVETDMSVKDILSLLKIAINIEPGNIEKKTLYGESSRNSKGASIFVIDENVLKEDLEYLMSGDYKSETTEDTKDNDETNNDEKTNGESSTINYENYKIVILNGSGESGVARRVSDLLKIQDIKSEVGGNASSFDNAQTIIYYNSNKDLAEKILEIVGVGKIQSGLSEKFSTKADLIIVLGKDFKK